MGAPSGIRENVEACLKENGKLTRLAISRKTGLNEDQVASSLYYLLKQQGTARKELDGGWILIPENERKEPAAPMKVERAMPAPAVRVVNAAAPETSPMTATEVLARQQPEPRATTSVEVRERAIARIGDLTAPPTQIEEALTDEIARLTRELDAAEAALDAYRSKIRVTA